MSETPDSDYTDVSIPDEGLPEDLQTGGTTHWPSRRPTTPIDRISGDPHIAGLERDDDDNLVLPDADASCRRGRQRRRPPRCSRQRRVTGES